MEVRLAQSLCADHATAKCSARQTASEGSGMERLLNEKLTVAGCGNFSEVNNFFQRAWARKVLADAAKEKQEGLQGSVAAGVALQSSSGANQKDCGYRLQCPKIVRRAHNAGKSGNWESFKEEVRRKGTFERLQEASDKFASEDIGRLSIAQEILKKEHGLLDGSSPQPTEWEE